MRKIRVAVLFNMDGLNWESCRDISAGLQQAYARLGGNQDYEVRRFGVSAHRVKDWNNIFNELAQFAPDVVSIVDHSPYPVLFFKQLESLPPCRIFIHIYGCFRFWCHSLKLYRPLFDKHRFYFLAPSGAQMQLLKNGFSEGVYKFPFPLVDQWFQSLANSSHQARVYKTESTRPLLVYTGRLHLQKNTLQLISFLKEFQKKQNFQFVLAGMYDNSPIDRLGINTSYGTIERLHEEALEGTDFQYLGVLDKASLLQLYSEADLNVSLSTYNDEDFGVSPLEALTSGVPSLLTAWGGYRDYQSDYCQLLPVRYLNGDLELSYTEFSKILTSMLNRPVTKTYRSEVQSYYMKRFSVDTAAMKLRELLHCQSLVAISSEFELPYPAGRLNRWSYLRSYEAYYA